MQDDIDRILIPRDAIARRVGELDKEQKRPRPDFTQVFKFKLVTKDVK